MLHLLEDLLPPQILLRGILHNPEIVFFVLLECLYMHLVLHVLQFLHKNKNPNGATLSRFLELLPQNTDPLALDVVQALVLDPHLTYFILQGVEEVLLLL